MSVHSPHLQLFNARTPGNLAVENACCEARLRVNPRYELGQFASMTVLGRQDEVS